MPPVPLRRWARGGMVPLMLCGGGLLGIIGAELFWGAGSGVAPDRVASVFSVPPQDAGGEAGHQQVRWVATILSRPLFSPSRRMAADMAQGTQALRLAGIITSPAGRRAIFAPTGTPDRTDPKARPARGLAVGEGGQAGPWRVRHIDTRTVEVEGTDGVLSLRPERAHGHGRASPASTADEADTSSADDDIVIPETRVPARPDAPHP